MGTALAQRAQPSFYAEGKTAAKAKVGIVQSSEVWKDNGISEDEIIRMLDRGLQSITGCDTASRAWNSLFVSKDVVALKVNCIARETGSTQPELSRAIAACLSSYVDIPIKNIIEKSKAEKLDALKVDYLRWAAGAGLGENELSRIHLSQEILQTGGHDSPARHREARQLERTLGVVYETKGLA